LAAKSFEEEAACRKMSSCHHSVVNRFRNDVYVIMYKISVCTSRRMEPVSIVNTSDVVAVWEVVAVYCVNSAQLINTPCCTAWTFLMLQQVVHVLTITLKRLKLCHFFMCVCVCVYIYIYIQRDSKTWTQFRRSIFPELYMVCE